MQELRALEDFKGWELTWDGEPAMPHQPRLKKLHGASLAHCSQNWAAWRLVHASEVYCHPVVDAEYDHWDAIARHIIVRTARDAYEMSWSNQ